MDLKRFTASAQAAFDEIPEEYRDGIDGLVIERRADRHPTLRDIYTLGMCDTESYVSEWVGPDTTRSRIILYYGSFRALARMDPDFDWEAEIHETVQHEVKHHLEAEFGSFQQARWVAEDGLRRIADILEPAAFERNASVARAYVLAGFANRWLGENQCASTVDGGPAFNRTYNANHTGC